MANPIRLAVVGGSRGGSFNHALKAFDSKIRLDAICDLSEEVLANWKKGHPGIRTTNRYETLLEDAEIDAVLVATPVQLHARQALQALKAGKHVLSEVFAACTLDECWELVETVEKTGLTYMLAENYCYTRQAMMIKHLCEQGLFGALTYAEGAYIHDCRALMYYPDGTRTWRGAIRDTQSRGSNVYPTHSLGPVAQWMGITRGDRFLRTTTFVTKEAARHEWAQALLGKDHPDAQPSAWQGACDSASTLIETEKGRVILLRVDVASPRPHNMTHYVLQGTRGAYLSPRWHKDDPLVWLEGFGKGSAMPHSKAEPEWQSLWDFADRYEHPRWKKHGEQAKNAGHGGGDFFELEDFADAIFHKKLPPIDVYDAVTWSCIAPLSALNVQKQGEPLDVPDFLRGRQRPA